MNPAQAAQRAAQQNAEMRALLLATAPRNQKLTQTWTGPNTQPARIKLFNVGILTKLRLLVSVAITIGTATAVPSPKAPFNMIANITLNDYDNTSRVNMSGFQMFIVNCVRARTYWGYQNEAATAVNANPVVPTAVGAAVVSFFLDIPIAYDVDNPILQLQDLRGAILAQTGVGEMYLTVSWNQSYYLNTDVESLYFGAPTTTVVANGANNITLSVWQQYLFPQNIPGMNAPPFPALDLTTVYELNGGVRSTDNLAVGTEKLLSFPNVRSVVGSYFFYVQQQLSATGMAFANMGNIRLIANGNNILEEDSNASHVFRQRMYLNSDTVPGVYFKTFREKPIETQMYGNMQIGMTPAVVGTTPNVEIGYESFYTKGAALPGLVQGT